ncbi:hypothetical protein [Bacillus sp. 3255]|uniref:hypothetical protein n=1 Tax=Bacillus sp. 3255 TaxID=2817904 RepID=UPI002855F4FE|nr:hypothetical protein [Bacillus sp. 3255]MDR6882503.1 hypothetical protein [Bacillus sp. 3255]
MEDKWELRHLIEEFERICHIIDEADEMIKKLLPEIPCSDLVRSVGVSVPATAALLHVEVTYVNFLMVIRYCGRLG